MDAPALENHFFLSYAHRDDEGLLEGQKGWVENFQRALGVGLGQLLGADSKIWWDHTVLRGNQVFAGVIDEGLSRSAVLIPILSPSYRTSDWCRKELEAFCAAAERAGGVRIGNQSRIFKVIKTPVPYEEHPAALRDLLGYEFFRKDPTSGRVRELRLQDASRVDPEYLQRIDDLAEDIRLFLEQLTAAPASGAGSPKAEENPVLFLAESTYDLAAERDRVLRMLRQRAYTVLPDQPLPFNGPALRQLVRSGLERARLSIHLVGANYGAIPEAETESIVEIQNQLAAERSADPSFCRLIWMPPGLEPADERQRAFVERLRGDSDAQRGAEILPTTLEVLETVIEDKLKRADAEPLETGCDELRYVYLLCDRRDLEAAEALRDFLYDHDERLEVTLPLFEGEEADVRGYHKENLTTCDGVLLFFGRATEPWLRAKLLDLRKAPGYGRSRPLSAKAIYMGPPASPAKERFRTREALVLESSDEPSAEVLAPFLSALDLGDGA